MYRVGFDVGGTFTDFTLLREDDGTVSYFKVPSTPADPSQAIESGLAALIARHAISPASFAHVGHGTTVATNLTIERKGAVTGLLVTKGFRDVLEIGRQTRPHLYSFQLDHPEPLVPRHRRFEVDERITDGPRVITPLDEQSVAAAVTAVRDSGAEACAVCLLFSYLDRTHERRIGEALAQANGHLLVSLSSEVQPEFREYERFSTTVLNAYLQPVIGRYLSYLESRLAADTPQAKVGIYQSSGGLMSIDTARRYPVRTALSGPAAGAVGAIHTARQSKQANVITLDMGGTSADVALIRNYEAGLSFDRAVAGFPVRLPMVDIHTVGAGGGSIAWFDRDGLLKVGPASAGADPGPACYGRGGTNATVTDANLVLGRLSARGLIGGRMPLDAAAARAVIAPIAARLGFSLERTALGIIDIVVANMVRAIRTVSVERGHDPRNYCLLPFGGAGPLHASQTARSLGISRFLVPFAPGILCAQGLIASDLKDDFVRSARIRLEQAGFPALRRHLADLMEEAHRWFAREDVAPRARAVRLSFDMRYVGQNFELPVTVASATGGRMPRLIGLDTLRQRFYAAHDQFYGFHNETDQVEIVNLRLTASASIARLHAARADEAAVRLAPVESRLVWFGGSRPVRAPVYDRAGLRPGHRIRGPAIVEQFDSTTVLYPNDRLEVDEALNLVVRVAP
jgi:N-methylhydantoinase A